MIRLSVSQLTFEQVTNLERVLTKGFDGMKPVSPMAISYIPHVDGTWGVTVEGRDEAARLVFILTNEDSGADYLV